MEHFTAKDVTAVTGVKRTRLQQWLEQGWITPSIQQADGHGTRNVYSRNDLYAIAFFRRVVESGLPRKVVADIISKGVLAQDITRKQLLRTVWVYVRDGENTACGISEVDDPESWSLFYTLLQMNVTGFDDVMVFYLGRVVRKVDEKIAEVK